MILQPRVQRGGVGTIGNKVNNLNDIKPPIWNMSEEVKKQVKIMPKTRTNPDPLKTTPNFIIPNESITTGGTSSIPFLNNPLN